MPETQQKEKWSKRLRQWWAESRSWLLFGVRKPSPPKKSKSDRTFLEKQVLSSPWLFSRPQRFSFRRTWESFKAWVKRKLTPIAKATLRALPHMLPEEPKPEPEPQDLTGDEVRALFEKDEADIAEALQELTGNQVFDLLQVRGFTHEWKVRAAISLGFHLFQVENLGGVLRDKLHQASKLQHYETNGGKLTDLLIYEDNAEQGPASVSNPSGTVESTCTQQGQWANPLGGVAGYHAYQRQQWEKTVDDEQLFLDRDYLNCYFYHLEKGSDDLRNTAVDMLTDIYLEGEEFSLHPVAVREARAKILGSAEYTIALLERSLNNVDDFRLLKDVDFSEATKQHCPQFLARREMLQEMREAGVTNASYREAKETLKIVQREMLQEMREAGVTNASRREEAEARETRAEAWVSSQARMLSGAMGEGLEPSSENVEGLDGGVKRSRSLTPNPNNPQRTATSPARSSNAEPRDVGRSPPRGASASTMLLTGKSDDLIVEAGSPRPLLSEVAPFFKEVDDLSAGHGPLETAEIKAKAVAVGVGN